MALPYVKNDKIDADELDRYAQTKAKEMEMGKSRTQFRRFYGEVKAIERLIEVKGQSNDEKETAFQDIRPRLVMLKSRARYNKDRSGGEDRLTEPFVKFIFEGVDESKSYPGFKNWCLGFEAIVGYNKNLGQQQRENRPQTDRNSGYQGNRR